VFVEAKDDGGGGDHWTTGAISRAKLQSNHHHQQTNIQFFTGRMPLNVIHHKQFKLRIRLHAICDKIRLHANPFLWAKELKLNHFIPVSQSSHSKNFIKSSQNVCSYPAHTCTRTDEVT